jgi:hypothetical protein
LIQLLRIPRKTAILARFCGPTSIKFSFFDVIAPPPMAVRRETNLRQPEPTPGPFRFAVLRPLRCGRLQLKCRCCEHKATLSEIGVLKHCLEHCSSIRSRRSVSIAIFDCANSIDVDEHCLSLKRGGQRDPPRAEVKPAAIASRSFPAAGGSYAPRVHMISARSHLTPQPHDGDPR